MSHDSTEQTKLGPGLDITGISGAGATIYPDDAEMEDTASSLVRVVGEVVPGSTESSLGLTSMDVPTVESSLSVMGLRTVETRDQLDVDTQLIARAVSDDHVSKLAPNGSRVTHDVPHHQAATTASSRRSRSKSLLGRALSPRPRI